MGHIGQELRLVFRGKGKLLGLFFEGLSGLWCLSLGYGEERLVEAAAAQMRKLPYYHTFTQKVADVTIDLAEKLERFASIPQHERELAENLLFSHPPKDVPAEHSSAELLHNVPADWREQKKEQRAAVNQYHIAAIAEYFRTAKKP